MRANEGGFTLIELLITVAILAAVAFVATGHYVGVSEHANDQLVRSEMQEIAQAIRQFRQDTGYYPKTGPFALTGDAGEISLTNLPTYAGTSDTEKMSWFYSPANFSQLGVAESVSGSVNPLAGTGHQLEEWDPESGRGWRGPYLKGFAEGYVNISDELNDGSGAGFSTGSPVETVSTSEIGNVPGLADPFEYPPDSGSGYLAWSAEDDGEARDYWGRPYLLFGLDDEPWLVSFGPDGKYSTDDDIILEIE